MSTTNSKFLSASDSHMLVKRIGEFLKLNCLRHWYIWPKSSIMSGDSLPMTAEERSSLSNFSDSKFAHLTGAGFEAILKHYPRGVFTNRVTFKHFSDNNESAFVRSGFNSWKRTEEKRQNMKIIFLIVSEKKRVMWWLARTKVNSTFKKKNLRNN